MRSVVPSRIGLKPRLASRIARSTAPTTDLSQTETEIMRGSGTVTVASWLSGIVVPYAGTWIGSSRLLEARPGAQRSEVVLEGRDRAVHAPMQIIEINAVRHFPSPFRLARGRGLCLEPWLPHDPIRKVCNFLLTLTFGSGSCACSTHHRAVAVAPQNSAEAAFLVNRIDDYRNVVFARKRNRGGVHDRQAARQHFVMADAVVARRVGIASWDRPNRRRRPGFP